MHGKKPREINKPFQVGIWCDRGMPALPGNGGPDFTNALAEGLLALDERLEIVLFTRPDDTLAGLQSRSGGRMRIVPQLEAESSLPRWLLFILRQIGPWFAGSADKKRIANKAIRRFRSRIAHDFLGLLGRAWFQFQTSPMAGLPLLILGGFLATFILLVYWALYALKQMVAAGWQSLLLPWRVLYHIEGFRRRWQLLLVGLDPLILAKEEECDVWLIPSLTFRHDLKDLDIPTVIVLPSNTGEIMPGPLPEEVHRIASSRAAEATLCVRIPSVGQGQLRKVWQVDPAKIREVPPFPITDGSNLEPEPRQRTLKEVAGDWLKVFREAVVEAEWRADLKQKLVRPWPHLESFPASPHDRLRAFLFLPVNYLGGVLQVTKELVSELAPVNRERKRLDLALGLLEEQGNIDNIAQLGNEVPIYRMRIQSITRAGIVRMMGGTPSWLTTRPEPQFCFLSGAERHAFQADAWFSMIDRFPQPLLPARPLGVIVQDVLQRRYPQFFDPAFFKSQASAMIPTCRAAEIIVTMTPQTRDDVIAEYGLEPSRVRLIPVSCNPHWHFDGVEPEPLSGIRQPLILNVANSSPHKGGDVLLRAFSLLKGRSGNGLPQLVMCGVNTQAFAPGSDSRHDQPYWHLVRRLVKELGLEVGRDVLFLGPVSDGQLCYLMRRCSVVVNAALYDNGCLSLAEGAYFGRPIVSTRYPAAEFHAHRFGYRPFFFPVGDVEALAAALGAALEQPSASEAEVQWAQAHFLDPEFSFRRYAERIYDVLVELAQKGRSQRNRLEPIGTEAA